MQKQAIPKGIRGGVAALLRTISLAKLDREGAPKGAAAGRVTRNS
jgi:hypothetical protein